MTMSSRNARTLSKSRPIVSITRGVKFSTITSQVGDQARATVLGPARSGSPGSGPSCWCSGPRRSATAPTTRLGDRDARDQPGAVRARGRLEVDDLGAEHREHVRARRARPEGGHVEHAKSRERQALGARRGLGSADAVATARGSRRCARRAAAPAAARAGPAPCSRYGRSGCTKPSRGLRTNVPRATKWSIAVTFSPLPTGEFGMRKAEASSRTSSTCSFAQPFVQFGCVDVGLLGDRQRRALVDPLLVAGHGAQVPPLLRRSATQRHQTVGGLRDTRNRGLALGPPRPAQHLEEGHRVVGEAEDLGLEHRQIDQFTPPVSSARVRDANVTAAA